MNRNDRPLVALPEDLPDEAAVAVLDWLYETARVFENHYAAQLNRHYHRHEQRQCRLWPEDDPPF